MSPIAKQVSPPARGTFTKLSDGTADVLGSASYGEISGLVHVPSAWIVETGTVWAVVS
jgi:hypothetical protein